MEKNSCGADECITQNSQVVVDSVDYFKEVDLVQKL